MNHKKVLICCFTVLVLLLFTGCTTNNTNNGSNDQNWLDSYTPIHSLGTGVNDFWVTYPSINPSTGESVTHLEWLVESMEDHCVLFVVHRTGCEGCKAQADRVIDLAEQYEEQVMFHDLDIYLGGSIEQRANEVYLYDPEGPPGYIALTGIFTYIKENNDVKIGWHTWEGNVENSEMESWIRDAIYYYSVNSEG